MEAKFVAEGLGMLSGKTDDDIADDLSSRDLESTLNDLIRKEHTPVLKRLLDKNPDIDILPILKMAADKNDVVKFLIKNYSDRIGELDKLKISQLVDAAGKTYYTRHTKSALLDWVSNHPLFSLPDFLRKIEKSYSKDSNLLKQMLKKFPDELEENKEVILKIITSQYGIDDEVAKWILKKLIDNGIYDVKTLYNELAHKENVSDIFKSMYASELGISNVELFNTAIKNRDRDVVYNLIYTHKVLDEIDDKSLLKAYFSRFNKYDHVIPTDALDNVEWKKVGQSFKMIDFLAENSSLKGLKVLVNKRLSASTIAGLKKNLSSYPQDSQQIIKQALEKNKGAAINPNYKYGSLLKDAIKEKDKIKLDELITIKI